MDEFRELILRFQQERDVAALSEALLTLSEIIQEGYKNVDERLGKLEARLRAVEERLDSGLRDLTLEYERLANSYSSLVERVGQLEKGLFHLGDALGALVETTYSRFFLDYIREEGYHVVRATRNYRVDSEDIDLFVEAEKEGEKYYFVVEVKVRPKHSDVGILLAKAELVASRLGVEVKPVLVGARIGHEVELYARNKGVLVVVF